MYWRITAIDEYIDQVASLPFEIQDLIQNKWIEVAKHKTPTEIGNTSTCGDNQTSPNVVVIFPGLAFEFIYIIDQTEKTIRLINCEKFTFLDYSQID
ncbi:MAG: hypothetical protein DLM72_12510 [Candidatus Nitrosopolaris wilkensis]|nr:MAG: hypothetical protein DLM72_12510 [Candidatus Nitrosopolaris wilkensis]